MGGKARRPRRSALPTVGLIVEGDTEFEALPKLSGLLTGCPPLKPTNLRGIGSDRKPEGIAKLVVQKVIAHLSAQRTKVIICVDLEDRQVCPGDFAQAISRSLKAELAEKGYAAADIHLVVVNRAFEAWLLADARGFHRRRVFKKAPSFVCFEGSLGGEGKKGVVELDRLLGRGYSKTADGPKLFAQVEFAEARKCKHGQHGSKSLDKLLRTLGV